MSLYRRSSDLGGRWIFRGVIERSARWLATEQNKGIFDVRWEFHTFRGDPYSGLTKAADELKADAVVVGASEQAGHRIVGSVAVRLVKAGRWPVTVVP